MLMKKITLMFLMALMAVASYAAETVVTPPTSIDAETWYLSCFGEYDYDAEVKVVVDGNDMYVQGLGFEILPDAWVKGTIANGKVTFAKGQYMGEASDYYGDYDLYLTGYDYKAGSMCDLVFDYDQANGLLTTSLLLVLNASPDELDYMEYYSDLQISKTAPELPTAIEAPAGLVTEEYLVTTTAIEEDDETGEEVKKATSFNVMVGFDGNDVYVNGLLNGFDGWAKGTLSADGKTITFPVNQYLGSEEYLYSTYDYFFTAANEKDEMVGVVLNYDATNKIMTTNQTIYINGSRHDLYYYYIYEGMTMTKMTEKAATPATPAITKFTYLSTLQYGYITLNIPLADVESNPLLSSKLYYQIMVEDKEGKVAPLTFSKDLYEDLEEDMTTIPYNHYDYDISNTFIYLCSTLDEVSNWKQIGIKSIYTGNGETHESEIGWCTVVISDDMVYDGIAATKAQPVSVSYVDMAGRRVCGTQKGLLIRQERMADGSVKNVKVVRK